MPRLFSPTTTWALLATAPAAVYVALRAVPEWDHAFASPVAHFYIVTAVSGVAAALAGVATVAATRLENYRALFLACAFVSMALLFCVHGLSTPGFIVTDPYYAVAGFSARLSVLAASFFLAASTYDPPARIAALAVRARIPAMVVLVGGLVGLGAALMAWPQHLPMEAMSRAWFLEGSLVVTLLFAGYAVLRYLDGYRHSQLPTFAALATGGVLMVQAQVGMHFSPAWYTSWWLYHVQLLLAFSAMLWAVASEYQRGSGALGVIERLTLSDPLLQIEAGRADVVRSFATSLEARDPYTHGHGRRVAILAVLIGQRMGLSPPRLRALSQGALLHDVGKIAVPDAVLGKPGDLTADEYQVIKGHPSQGAMMLGSAFRGTTELAVIRHHHEWYDGSGYPDALAGDAIPLEARIAAVADVYDALRSDRSYRPAWTAEKAQALMREESGTHFDPACVEALFEVVDRFEAEFCWEVEQGLAAADTSTLAPDVEPAAPRWRAA